MSPKEKAKELVDKLCVKITPDAVHATDMSFYKSRAKQCALIAVSELIKESRPNITVHNRGFNQEEYWQQVKKQIELL